MFNFIIKYLDVGACSLRTSAIFCSSYTFPSPSSDVIHSQTTCLNVFALSCLRAWTENTNLVKQQLVVLLNDECGVWEEAVVIFIKLLIKRLNVFYSTFAVFYEAKCWTYSVCRSWRSHRSWFLQFLWDISFYLSISFPIIWHLLNVGRQQIQC